MRLDLFLKVSRLCPRRSAAQTLCDAGLVFANQHVAKSSYSVKPGDEIIIRRRNRETTVKILAVPEVRQLSRNDAVGLYQIVSERLLDPATD
jgi:ribosomal 50S subunit-recycling heat shock protein